MTGMAGVADEAFYAAAYAFLDRHPHPPIVRHAMDFHYGLASWDFARASAAADGVLTAGDDARQWVPLNLLVEGGVTARLRLGDFAGVRALYGRLRDDYGRAPEHLRRRLIEAYLAAMGEANP